MRIRGPLIVSVFAGLIIASICGCMEGGGDRNDETTLAFQQCLDRGKSQSLSAGSIRNFCIHKLQRKLPDIEGGQAGWSDFYAGGRQGFTGWLRNSHKNYVVTGFSIVVFAPKQDGGDTEQVFENRWIEPGTTDKFFISADEMKSQPKAVDGVNRAVWSTGTVYGLEIKI
ncbi:hypothetical protein [Methylorubrum extorquens]|uniref:Lipoprotein n=1 Tax=Methylorubrum extorquens TaxID=408 RepID=A0AAX3WD14_METEX|nr:hypothetical protein [Methylorubrum extorquens]WHQ69477.1 hypothetical protein KEC54_24575 [Methylorubrum extorquens]